MAFIFISLFFTYNLVLLSDKAQIFYLAPNHSITFQFPIQELFRRIHFRLNFQPEANARFFWSRLPLALTISSIRDVCPLAKVLKLFASTNFLLLWLQWPHQYFKSGISSSNGRCQSISHSKVPRVNKSINLHLYKNLTLNLGRLSSELADYNIAIG